MFKKPSIIDANSNGIEEKIQDKGPSPTAKLRRNFSWRTQDQEEISTVAAAANSAQPVPANERRATLHEEEIEVALEKPKLFDGLFKKKEKAPVTSFDNTVIETIPENSEEEKKKPHPLLTSFRNSFKGLDIQDAKKKAKDKLKDDAAKKAKDKVEDNATNEGEKRDPLRNSFRNSFGDLKNLLKSTKNKTADGKENVDEHKETQITQQPEDGNDENVGLDITDCEETNPLGVPEEQGKGSKWEAEVLSEGTATQEDFMHKDECIVVDFNDNVIGHDTKLNCHRFVPGKPRGILHRAFSVFLFDSRGRLLLQQRAASKITFPSVWTNTCCSHQLYSQDPSELDEPESIQANTVNGAKVAAVRKLAHELGIKADQVPLSKFKFLTRMHYYATDAVTHGPHTVWGEHEIDYILLIQADVDLNVNPEEVDAVKYVTQRELKEMMNSDNGLLWSPWFRFIMETWGFKWWANLKKTLRTDEFVDNQTIHRFDPPPEHRSCAGISGVEIETESDKEAADSKQGGYGKVRTHKESKLSQFLHLGEAGSALYYMTVGGMKKNIELTNEDEKYCEEMLKKVSRSFAAVILQLPKDLTMAILVFYLVLRGLDTIEDDMQAYKDPEEKKEHLRTFYKTALEDDKFSLKSVGEGDEKDLIENFGTVSRVFQSLEPNAKEVIADICKKMGEGMAEYVGADLGQGTADIESYNRYCHYVAGLVGEGLSRLFSASGKEDAIVGEDTDLSNSMGLFLQKTNIIRDFLEDYVDGRAWWPKSVWKNHSESGQLGEFVLPEFQKNAVSCLNELVTDALLHAPDCLKYMERLKNKEVFRFCAIPQVMAISTLDKVYNNANVFSGVVKIRKSLAVKMIVDTTCESGLHLYFNKFAKSVKSRIPSDDPSAQRTHEICDLVMKLTAAKSRDKMIAGGVKGVLVVAILAVVLQFFGIMSTDYALLGEIAVVIFCVVYMIATSKSLHK